jgi:glutathione peroxidase
MSDQSPAESLGDFSATAIDGTEVDLSAYDGNVVLIVNTASQCGFTPQLAGLQTLHERYGDQGLTVLGFPCNQFGGQEPGERRGDRCLLRVATSASDFQIMEKTDVNGAEAHPLFQWLNPRGAGPAGHARHQVELHQVPDRARRPGDPPLRPAGPPRDTGPGHRGRAGGIDSELGRVPTEHREALDLIALSEPVALATVLEAAGEADWADSIEALATAGLVQVDSSDPAETIVRMGHLLYGAHARDRVPVSRRRELHAKRYAGVDPDGLTESEFDKWVRWSLEGGLSVTPAQLLRTAKSSATAGHDGVALSLAESAVAGFPEHSAERVEALLLCSVLHVHGGAAAQAKALIDTVIADLDDCVADDFTRMLLGAGAYRIRADLEQFAFDDPAAALATVDETIEALPGLSAFVDVRCVRARRLAWAGDTSGVAQLLPWIEVVSIPAPLEILEVVALGITELVSRGEVDRGLELSARYWGQAVDAHETMTWIGFELTAATLLAYVSAGRLKDLAAHEHLMPLMTQRHDEASARVGMGELLGRQGDWERAWHEISQAVQTLRWRDAAGLLTWALSAAADAAMMTGRAAEAAAFLAEVDQGLKGASRGMAATARLHSCRAAIGLGLADAPGRCAELASWAQEWGYDLVRLDALHLLGLASPEALRRHLAEAAPLPLPHPSAPVMAALSDHITAVLGGRKTSVANSLKLLSEMGRWTPVVRASPHLTKRERQIAIMVAAGDSSPAIAERLHLSVRTVETHVSRVMAKLGVSRRSDIAGVLAPESVVGAPPGHPPRTVFPPAR